MMTPEEIVKALEIPCEVDCPQRGLRNLCHPEMCVRYKAFCKGVWAGRKSSLEVYRRSFRRGWMCALNEFLRLYKMGHRSYKADKAINTIKKLKRAFSVSMQLEVQRSYDEDKIVEGEVHENY